jgi:hypothetical protein
MDRPKMTHFASELDYEIYDEKYNTLTAEDIIHFYGLDESDFEVDEELEDPDYIEFSYPNELE